MKQAADDGGQEYVRIADSQMKDGGQLRFWCPVAGTSLEELMARVYALAADSVVRDSGQHP